MKTARVLEAITGGKPRISMEVIPPERGGDMECIFAAVEAAMRWQPAFISVTDHAAAPAGGHRGREGERPPRARPGTLGTVVALRDEFQVATVPHLVATGATRHG